MKSPSEHHKFPQRILVTGGAGFIGSHTVELLLKQGSDVVVLDNLSFGKLENLNLAHPQLEFIEGDVLEFPLVADIIASCDAVLHLAAMSSVQLSIEDPIYSFQVNTQGFLHVLESVRRANRPIRLVYASSAAVYGDTTALPCDDAKPLTGSPLSPYTLQKRHCEDYANLYVALHNIPSLALRYFNVYGLRQDPSSSYSGVISRFIAAYKNETPITIFGDGSQSRDFISVNDIASANVLALANDYVGALNIATGTPETLLNLINYIELAGGHPTQKSLQPARQGDIHTSYATTNMAEQHIGFKAEMSLKEGMAQMLALSS
jgi:nucleoside-diphosphate-sugar epimerase